MILEKVFNLKTFTQSSTAERLKIDNTEMTDEQLENGKHLHSLLLEIQNRLSTKYQKQINIQINSAFRSKELNKAVGGVLTSDHCTFSAADTVAIGIPIEDYYNDLRHLAKINVMLFGQVILEFGKFGNTEKDDWVHLALPRKGKMNDFMRSTITNGRRSYVKEPIV